MAKNEVFKRLRVRLRLNQQGLAELLGVSKRTIQDIEQGKLPSKTVTMRFDDLMQVHGFDEGSLMASPEQVIFSDREIGRLEGRIEELERQVLRYEEQLKDVLESVAGSLQDKKTKRSVGVAGVYK